MSLKFEIVVEFYFKTFFVINKKVFFFFCTQKSFQHQAENRKKKFSPIRQRTKTKKKNKLPSKNWWTRDGQCENPYN
jgi:hypothetical protein